MRQDKRQDWNETEFRLAVLQVLLGARKLDPRNGGAGGEALMDVLSVEDDRLMMLTLEHLRDEELISVAERVFQITAKGVDLVEEHFPDCTPFDWFDRQSKEPAKDSGEQQPPWFQGDGPGPFPPRHDPDDPSPVPKNGKPSQGAGEIALPLPPPQDLAG